MAAYFFDSSATVKRYVAEIGTAWVQGVSDIAAGNEVHLSDLTIVEVCAAVSRRRREGSLAETLATSIRAEFLTDVGNLYLLTGLSDSIIDRAVALAESHVLRASDAIQLSTAIEINTERLSRGLWNLTFASSDRMQIKAALAEGLPVVDPAAQVP